MFYEEFNQQNYKVSMNTKFTLDIDPDDVSPGTRVVALPLGLVPKKLVFIGPTVKIGMYVLFTFLKRGEGAYLVASSNVLKPILLTVPLYNPNPVDAIVPLGNLY